VTARAVIAELQVKQGLRLVHICSFTIWLLLCLSCIHHAALTWMPQSCTVLAKIASTIHTTRFEHT